MSQRSGTIEKYFSFALVLLWLFLIQGLGVFLFTKGFFLTRFEIDDKSSCYNPPFSEHRLFSSNPDRPFSDCWMPRRFNKVVVLLFDALRVDFLWWNDSISPEDATRYQNKMSYPNALVRDFPRSAHMFRFVADPPTATMQRLKALTTGGLPTFMEVSKSFATPVVNEDSFVFQFGRQRGVRDGRTVFMGDDTWEGLYPNAFTEMIPYPCFNVKDLDTVDSGVTEHLVPKIKEDGWRLIVAHFLGIDHCGHTFGTDFPCMERKLKEYQEVMESVWDSIDEDTLVFAFGDHGLTFDGNHGGATEEEMNAGLLLFSKREFLNGEFLRMVRRIQHEVGVIPQEMSGQKVNPYVPPRFPNRLHAIMQVDMVPSMSIAAGAASPFVSVGMIMPEVFSIVDHESSSSKAAILTSFAYTNEALKLSSAQLHNYIKTYARKHSFPADALARSEELFWKALKAYAQVSVRFPRDFPGLDDRGMADLEYAKSLRSQVIEEAIAQHSEVYRSFLRYNRFVAEFCRTMWTEFDFVAMTQGSVLVAVALCVMCLLYLSTYFSRDPVSIRWVPMGVCGVLGVVGGFWFGMDWIIVCASLGSVIGMVIGMSWDRRAGLIERALRINVSIESLIAGGFLVFHGISLFTNSFIITDEVVVHFILASGLLSYGILGARWMRSGTAIRLLVMMVFVRLSLAHTRSYHSTFGLDGTVLLPSFLEKYPPLLILPMLGTILALRVRTVRWHWTAMISTACWLCSLGCAVYWAFEQAEALASWTIVRIWVPRLVYSVSLVTSVVIFLQSMPRWVSGRPSSLNWKLSLLAVVGVTSYPMLLVLGSLFCFSVGIFYAELILFSYLVRDWISARRVKNSGPNFLPSHAIIYWIFIGAQFFFVFGHHFQFNTLHFTNAFIGFETFSLYVNGTLLVLDTFGSYMGMLMSVPILATMPFTFMKKRSEILVNVQRPFLGALVYFGWNTLMSVLSVGLQRRHLMIWMVFSPKFCFDVMILLVVDVFVLLSYSILTFLLGP